MPRGVEIETVDFCGGVDRDFFGGRAGALTRQTGVDEASPSWEHFGWPVPELRRPACLDNGLTFPTSLYFTCSSSTNDSIRDSADLAAAN